MREWKLYKQRLARIANVIIHEPVVQPNVAKSSYPKKWPDYPFSTRSPAKNFSQTPCDAKLVKGEKSKFIEKMKQKLDSLEKQICQIKGTNTIGSVNSLIYFSIRS